MSDRSSKPAPRAACWLPSVEACRPPGWGRQTLEIRAAAFAAGAVAGGEGRGLVEKEKLGVGSRLHERAAATFER